MKQSPLTDSNRRPPPYHPGPPASGCNYRRLVARNRGAFEAAVFAVICGGLRPLYYTNAPYRPALVVEIDHFPRKEGVEMLVPLRSKVRSGDARARERTL